MMKIKLVSELKGGAVALVLPLLVAPVVKAASAQEHVTISELPEEPILQVPPPKPTAQKPLADGDQYFATAGAFCGTGASTSRVQTIPTVGCGLGVTLVPLPIFFEFGVMTPQANRSYLTGYISVDGSVPLYKPVATYLPMAFVGYSRLFETGYSFDYGLALAIPRPGKHADSSDSLRIELRDYWTFANPSQHNVMLRVGWMSEVAD
jgi:hypothetical protein